MSCGVHSIDFSFTHRAMSNINFLVYFDDCCVRHLAWCTSMNIQISQYLSWILSV